MPSLSNGDHENRSQNSTKAHSMHFTQSDTMPIAIVGMACRFPGEAANVKGLWDMCCEGRSAWSEIPRSRMNPEVFFHPNPSKTGTVCKTFFTLRLSKMTQPISLMPEERTLSKKM